MCVEDWTEGNHWWPHSVYGRHSCVVWLTISPICENMHCYQGWNCCQGQHTWSTMISSDYVNSCKKSIILLIRTKFAPMCQSTMCVESSHTARMCVDMLILRDHLPAVGSVCATISQACLVYADPPAPEEENICANMRTCFITNVAGRFWDAYNSYSRYTGGVTLYNSFITHRLLLSMDGTGGLLSAWQEAILHNYVHHLTLCHHVIADYQHTWRSDAATQTYDVWCSVCGVFVCRVMWFCQNEHGEIVDHQRTVCSSSIAHNIVDAHTKNACRFSRIPIQFLAVWNHDRCSRADVHHSRILIILVCLIAWRYLWDRLTPLIMFNVCPFLQDSDALSTFSMIRSVEYLCAHKLWQVTTP